jgi:membrane protease YdiL (CAAX protease family)
MALYGSMLAVSITATLIAVAAGEDLGFYGLGAQEVAFALIVLGFAAVCYQPLLPLIRRTGAARWLLAGPLLGMVTFIVATSAMGAMMHLLQMPNLEYLSTFTDSGHGFGAAVLMIAVYPAVVEELAFRGVILASLQRVISNTETIFVSGAMFAILHLSIPSFFHLFVMGVVLAWLRLRSRALLPCMLLHFTHNFLVLLAERQGGLLPW